MPLIMPIGFSLVESIPGWCPVCWQCWSNDPDLECDCTRAQPDDDEQAAAAYAKSAAHRTAKMQSDLLETNRRMGAAIRQKQGSNVVSINRAPASRRLAR